MSNYYLITLSALASTFGGIVSPICFAVFKIDHQLKLCRLLHGEIGRLGSLQDFVHIVGDAPVAVREVRSVVHEPTGIYSFLYGYIDGNRFFNAKPTIRF